MRVTLNINDKTYNYTKYTSKRKMSGAIGRLERENANLSGTAVVHYEGQFTNEFDFSTPDELRTKLWPCLEEGLLNDILKK